MDKAKTIRTLWMILFYLVAIPLAILDWIIDKADKLFDWLLEKMITWRDFINMQYRKNRQL